MTIFDGASDTLVEDDPDRLFDLLGSDEIEVEVDWENHVFILTPRGNDDG